MIPCFRSSPTSWVLAIDQTLPVPFVSGKGWGYDRFGNLRSLDNNQIDTPLGPQPPNFHYAGIGFALDIPRLQTDGDAFLSASIGLTPEPATLLLFGTTAAGVGLARWYRRTRAHAA
jgi:PEP-CTERM motif-containing protein